MAPTASRPAGINPRFSGIESGAEGDLVRRVRAGDEAAFEALFHAYHAALCAFVYRYLGARDLAEEIVQDVFLFVWDRRETWQVQSPGKRYLFTGARNASVRYLRHHRGVKRPESETVGPFSCPGESIDDGL